MELTLAKTATATPRKEWRDYASPHKSLRDRMIRYACGRRLDYRQVTETGTGALKIFCVQILCTKEELPEMQWGVEKALILSKRPPVRRCARADISPNPSWRVHHSNRHQRKRHK